MSHKIFLSHNHNDKPLVEAVALKLASIFGAEQVFYDSWSIKPGDSIIEKMSRGLESPEFVFFFVSKNSLSSGMVKLEWQNALFAASKGKTRIIPVRIDAVDMPAILTQTLFIDMYTVGLEAAIAQIVGVTQGNASFTPQHLGFSNLSYARSYNSNGSIDIAVNASHFMEPNPHFALIIENSEHEVEWGLVDSAAHLTEFNKDVVQLSNGKSGSCIKIRPMVGALTPTHPVRLFVKPRGPSPVKFLGLYHQKGETEWVPVPERSNGSIVSNLS